MTAPIYAQTPLAGPCLRAVLATHYRYWSAEDIAHHCRVSARHATRWITGECKMPLEAIVLLPPKFQAAFWAEFFARNGVAVEINAVKPANDVKEAA